MQVRFIKRGAECPCPAMLAWHIYSLWGRTCSRQGGPWQVRFIPEQIGRAESELLSSSFDITAPIESRDLFRSPRVPTAED